MNTSIPNYVVHMAASCLISHDGPHPNRKMTLPTTGILFASGKRRCVVGAAAKRFATDGLAITAVSGINHKDGSERKDLTHSFSVELASVDMVRTYEYEEQKWALLGVQIHEGEQPGRAGTDGCFVPAKPTPLPAASVFTPPMQSLATGTKLRVAGIRAKGSVAETVVVSAVLAKTYRQGVVVVLPKSGIDGVEFGGAPIFSGNNHLVAIGLFVGRLKSGDAALVGLSPQELVSCAGHMIDGIM